ncbi:MAG TPA: peroxiredoxin [Candidatus Hydrogenedentes bacterium]|nr:peroxiredoxin [Candidatus Hydrogenedentota bacterium]
MKPWRCFGKKTIGLIVGAGLLSVGVVMACQSTGGSQMMVEIGKPAPDCTFPAPLDDGTTKLSDYQGKKNVVLAFYPKAFTPHCTQQMCGYRDSINAFNEADTVLIGISLDTLEKSRAFKDQYHLPFSIVADPDRIIVKKYGVPVINLLFVKMAKRSVFLIDKEGVIRYVNRSYNVQRDEATLINEVKKLAPAASPILPSVTP